jgi:hypothetical protein
MPRPTALLPWLLECFSVEQHLHPLQHAYRAQHAHEKAHAGMACRLCVCVCVCVCEQVGILRTSP